MDLVIRYWNVDESKVESSYWNSSFLGHATHQHLFMHFETALEGRYQWMCPVSIGFFWICHKCLHLLTSVLVTYILCTVLSRLVQKQHIGRSKGAFYLLQDTPARREDFTSNWRNTISFVILCNPLHRR